MGVSQGPRSTAYTSSMTERTCATRTTNFSFTKSRSAISERFVGSVSYFVILRQVAQVAIGLIRCEVVSTTMPITVFIFNTDYKQHRLTKSSLSKNDYKGSLSSPSCLILLISKTSQSSKQTPDLTSRTTTSKTITLNPPHQNQPLFYSSKCSTPKSSS